MSLWGSFSAWKCSKGSNTDNTISAVCSNPCVNPAVSLKQMTTLVNAQCRQKYSESFPNRYMSYLLIGRPVSWILLAPAVSPREPGLAEGSGANNPAIRLVKFNTDNGQVYSSRLMRY